MDLYHLILSAVDVVFSGQEANLQTALRKRKLAFEVEPRVWQRLGTGLAEWQRGLISRVLRLDWQLLGNIPYVRLNSTDTGKMYAALDSVAAVNGFKQQIATKKRQRGDQQAMKFYRTQILQHRDGLLWLRKRQQKGMALVDNTLHLYFTSMDLCLERVNHDRDFLSQCFLDGNPIESLVDFIITDSDPHKGGKKVCLLDFTFRAGGRKTQRRIVYKPSDVEIDYRIAGRNTPEIQQLFHSRVSERLFPEPHESFFEMLDRLKFNRVNEQLAGQWSQNEKTKARMQALLSLPTYVILPRNPGSRMSADPETQKLPIDRSYGYLEYLTFHPKPPDLGAVFPALPLIIDYVSKPRRWQPDSIVSKGASDWILEDALLAKPAFRLWGRLMSMACVLLQTDLHHQNQRLHGLKPYVIDLENCLIKSCPLPGGPSGTLMPQALLKESAKGGLGNTSSVGTTNQLYLRRKGRKPVWLNITTPENAFQVKAGLGEALTAMTACREEIAHWVQVSGLADVIVRHVAEATGNLTEGMMLFAGELLKPDNADLDPDTLLQAFMGERRKTAVNFWEHAESPYVKQDNPKYGLEIPAYNGLDFKNRNVPVFYRQAGSLDLLTWWGEVVEYQHREDDSEDLFFAHYHQNKGIDLLAASLTAKLPKEPPELERQIQAFIDSVYSAAPMRIWGGSQ